MYFEDWNRAPNAEIGPKDLFEIASNKATKGGERRMVELAETMNQAVKVMADREGKYLTFTLAGEEYGIGI